MSHCLKTNKQTCYGLVHLPMPIEMRRFAYQCFRKSSASKTAQSGTQPLSQASASVAAGSDMGKNLERATETAESLVPMMPSSFIDAKVRYVMLLCLWEVTSPGRCVECVV
jgi:hypothetical protein